MEAEGPMRLHLRSDRRGCRQTDLRNQRDDV